MEAETCAIMVLTVDLNWDVAHHISQPYVMGSYVIINFKDNMTRSILETKRVKKEYRNRNEKKKRKITPKCKHASNTLKQHRQN